MLLTEKALDFQARLKRRIAIHKLEPRLQRARKLSARKMAGNDKIKTRSLRAAKNTLVKKISGGKGYNNLSTSQKISVDRNLDNKKGAIKRIAARLFQKKRKEEMVRLASARKRSSHMQEDVSLMNEIMEQLLDVQEGKFDPAIFKAVFTAGGPGSGKFFTANKIAFKAMGFKEVNIDTFFEHAMKKAGLSLKPDDIFSDTGQKIREKAKLTKTSYEDNLLRGRLGLVIDGTGKDVDKVKKHKQLLENIGYETAMVFVNTDLETSKERNRSRERSLHDNEVEKMWKDVQKNIGQFQLMFGSRFYVVDNSTSSKSEPQILGIYKEIQKWIRQPVNNAAARAWRETQ